MSGVRYRVDDLPPGGAAAFTPSTFPTAQASSHGLVAVSGSPGTRFIPVPAPTRVWAPPISADPNTQGSNVSPDVFAPDLYCAYADHMGPADGAANIGMEERRHNPLPMPALDWRRVPTQALGAPPRLGGRRVTPAVRAFQRWPTYGGGS